MFLWSKIEFNSLSARDFINIFPFFLQAGFLLYLPLLGQW